MTTTEERPAGTLVGTGRIKCVVWDLDNTVWDGVLLEGDALRLRPQVVSIIKTLDERGILHSIASRNSHEAALRQLETFGIAEYFLHPQVSWNVKSTAIATIAERLNIGIDSLAFVDDQIFELEEVAFRLPEVLCIHADDAAMMLDSPDFSPRFITDESSRRREMYRSGIGREEAEQSFTGDNDAFLSTLDMVLTIGPAQEQDLARAEELTIRTHQLNSTGVTYSYAELDHCRTADDHLLLVAGLEDRFGSYGKIGLALVYTAGDAWRLKLLLMSCRVMSRGVGAVLLDEIVRLAQARGKSLEAEFAETSRNRVMYVTYRFAGFREVGRDGGTAILRADPDLQRRPPEYLRIRREGLWL